MVDDDQVAEAAQPVREHHAAAGHRMHVGAFGGADEHAFPGRAVAAVGAEPRRQFAVHRHLQLAAQRAGTSAGKIAGLTGGRRRSFLAVAMFGFSSASMASAGSTCGAACLRPHCAPVLRLLRRASCCACSFSARARSAAAASSRPPLFGGDLGPALFLDQLRQLVDQAAQPLLVALEVAGFLALRRQLARQLRHQRGALRLFLLQQRPSGRAAPAAISSSSSLAFCVSAWFVSTAARLPRSDLDQFGLRLRQVGHQYCRSRLMRFGLSPDSSSLMPVFIAGHVLLAQQRRQLLFLRVDRVSARQLRSAARPVRELARWCRPARRRRSRSARLASEIASSDSASASAASSFALSVWLMSRLERRQLLL